MIPPFVFYSIACCVAITSTVNLLSSEEAKQKPTLNFIGLQK